MSVNCAASCPVCARLREAMLALVGDLGFAAVTAERLARETGVGADEVAAHAPSLEALLVEAFDDVVPRILDAYKAGFRSQRRWSARFAAGTAAVIDLYNAEPAIGRIAEIELNRAGPLGRAARDRGRREWLRFTIEELTAARDLRAPEVHFEVLGGAVCGVLLDTLDQRRRFTPAERHRIFEVVSYLEPPPSPAETSAA